MTAFKTWWAAKTTVTRIVLLFATLVILLELVGLAFGESVNSQTRVPGGDKLLHFLGFAALSLALTDVLRRHAPGFRWPALGALLFLAILAAADEAGQALNPARNVEGDDLIAGWCGLAVAGCWQMRRQRPLLAMGLTVTAFTVAGGVVTTSAGRQRHLNAAVRLERVGDFAGARREYLAALEKGAETAQVLNQLGWVEIESGIGDPAAAVRYSERALALRPDDPDIFDTYGWALHHVGRDVEALSYLDRAYARKPDIFCINYHLGEVLVALGHVDQARNHYIKQMEFVNTNEAGRARKALEELPTP